MVEWIGEPPAARVEVFEETWSITAHTHIIPDAGF
jgi:hypothetical protein